MRTFNLINNVDQILGVLKLDLNLQNIHDISLEMIEKLDYFELLELFPAFYINENFKKIIHLIDSEGYYNIIDNSLEKIKETEKSLSIVHFIAYLIGLKFKAISFECHPPLFDDFIEIIDNKIIKHKAKLNTELNDNFSIKDSFGLFFIHDKEVALNIFTKFVISKLKKYDFDTLAIELIMSKDVIFHKIGINHIPNFDHSNYKDVSLLKNDDQLFIEKHELSKILREKEYFNADYPLSEYTEKDLLNTNTHFSNFNSFQNEFIEFLNREIGNRAYYNKINIGEIFIDNICNKIPKYDIYSLIHAKYILLIDIINHDKLKNRFIAFFIYQYEVDNLTGITNILPALLSKYFDIENLNKNTIESYFKRPSKRPISLIKEIEYFYKYYQNLDKQS
ncbi:hypothetical protein [Faecalibacter macacae]|uniref:Uncharacterized protein n=1 Tax=Faecalibacter macacae TaxID=1859289 RepID=A0A3L9MBZ0_9FLAO|nr:hypothetical protein [Faecalibacter macacae]RLZ08049.1 hypothetical protein EAH69_10650 [Faecalibacter macacae]